MSAELIKLGTVRTMKKFWGNDFNVGSADEEDIQKVILGCLTIIEMLLTEKEEKEKVMADLLNLVKESDKGIEKMAKILNMPIGGMKE